MCIHYSAVRPIRTGRPEVSFPERGSLDTGAAFCASRSSNGYIESSDYYDNNTDYYNDNYAEYHSDNYADYYSDKTIEYHDANNIEYHDIDNTEYHDVVNTNITTTTATKLTISEPPKTKIPLSTTRQLTTTTNLTHPNWVLPSDSARHMATAGQAQTNFKNTTGIIAFAFSSTLLILYLFIVFRKRKDVGYFSECRDGVTYAFCDYG